MSDISDDTGDKVIRPGLRALSLKSNDSPDGTFTRQETALELAADDHDWLGGFLVGIAEVAARLEGDAHRTKIIGTDRGYRHGRLGVGPTFNHYILVT